MKTGSPSSGGPLHQALPWLGRLAERRLKALVFLLAVYTPFEPFTLNYVPEVFFLAARFGLYALIAAGCLLILLGRAARHEPVLPAGPLNAPLALFLVVAVLSLLAAGGHVFAAAASLQALLRFIVVGFYAALLMDWTKQDLRWLTRVLLLIAGGQAFIGLVQSWAGPGASRLLAPKGYEFDGVTIGEFTQHLYTSGFQVFATLGRYNVLALFLVFFGLLSLPLTWSGQLRRGPMAGGWALGGICLLLTAARGPWLGLAAGGWVLAALRKHWLAWALPLGGVIAAGALYAGFQGQIRYVGTADATPLERVLETFSPRYFEVHTQNYGRLYFLFVFPFALWQQGLTPFLLGYGPGMVGRRALAWTAEHRLAPFGMSPEQATQVDDATWPYLLAQMGLLGLLAFLWLLVRVLHAAGRAWRSEPDPWLRSLALGWLAAAAALIVGATFTTVFEIRPLGLYFWLYAGALVRFCGQTPAAQEEGNP